jgi:hypothetical protein
MGSRPHIFLVHVATPHVLHYFLTLVEINSPLFGDNLAKEGIDFTCHVRGITTHVEVSLLLEEIVDKLGIFFQTMLNVDLLRCLARESGENSKRVAESLLHFLVGG